MQLKIDPMALLTALGALLGAGTGGNIQGYGFQVGAEYVPGQGLRRVGFDPKLVMSAQLPGYSTGVTLGTTSLVNKNLVRDAERGIEYPDFQFIAKRELDRLMQYELGHQYGYNAFGIAYPAYAFAYPRKYDPAAAPLFGVPVRGWYSREQVMEALPRRHYNFSIEAGPTGDIITELARLLSPGR